jgi:hypothetical protein
MLVLTKSQVESLKRATEGMGNDATTEYRLMFIQLTEVQARCTELIQEARAAARYIAELENAMSLRDAAFERRTAEECEALIQADLTYRGLQSTGIRRTSR